MHSLLPTCLLSALLLHTDAHLPLRPDGRPLYGRPKHGDVNMDDPEERAVFLQAAAAQWPCDCSQRVIDSVKRPFRGVPPPSMPPDLNCAYTRCGTIATESFYVDDTRGGRGTHVSYSRTSIDTAIGVALNALERGKGVPNPTRASILEVFRAYRRVLNGSRVAVFGSNRFEDEALILAAGAAHVVVVEYNPLSYDHPRVSTMTPSALYADEALQHSFDVVVSLSSFDHDGLGRYGDPLCPDADLVMMDVIRTTLLPRCPPRAQQEMDAAGGVVNRAPREPGVVSDDPCPGHVILQLPVGKDVIAWNLHRRYGWIRLPLMHAGYGVEYATPPNWKFLTEDGGPVSKPKEPVWVLRPEREQEGQQLGAT